MNLPTSERAAALAQLHADIRRCLCCAEAGWEVTPAATVDGPVTAQIVLIGQSPGLTETQSPRPFSGPSGRRLFGWLQQAGWSQDEFRAAQYITAITKCYPGRTNGGQGDRVPSRVEQNLCAPFLARELALLRPRLIIPVGGLAIRHFLGPRRLDEVIGRVFSDAQGRWIVPLPHPSGASLWLNRPENQKLVERALFRIAELSKKEDN